MTTRATVRSICCALFAVALLGAGGAADAPAEGRRQGGAREYPPKMAGAEEHVYKTVGDVKLNLYVFKPADWKATDRRAAVVFFFGGGWTSISGAVE